MKHGSSEPPKTHHSSHSHCLGALSVTGTLNKAQETVSVLSYNQEDVMKHEHQYSGTQSTWRSSI